ncbi:MAG: Di-and tricarboxylate transporter [Anaerocolumna sp.]|jgi:sodium-dependent dicarboxylate transporter 2/3/5|nr:Di-and tricarboxylate transporter [Anaerocolumna sp.]
MDNKLSDNKFHFLDLNGINTGYNLKNKKTLAHVIISLILFFVCLALPLDFISQTASKALALSILVMYMWITLYVDLVTSCLVLAIGSVVLGLVSYADMSALFGESQFLPMFGVCIVALGATNTKLTTRFAYFLLWKLGKKPILIAFAAVIVTVIISSTVSNIATAILVAAAFAPILEELGDKRLSKAIMILIPMAAMYGGIALVNGAGPNLVALQNISTVTEGKYTVSYGQWAVVGWASAIILMPILVFIYTKYFKVSNKDVKIDFDKIHQKLVDIGPLTGAEIRWLIIVLLMIALLLAGFPMGTIGLLFGLICILPGVGIMSGKFMLSKTPWFLLFILGFSPILSTVLTQSGLANIMLGWTHPFVNKMGPFLLILFFTMLKSILNNIIISGPAPVSIIIITGFAPILISMGYNPAAIMMGSMLIAHPAAILGSVPTLQTTFQYGYWKINDTIVPGVIFTALVAIVISTVTYFLCPLIGLSFYI